MTTGSDYPSAAHRYHDDLRRFNCAIAPLYAQRFTPEQQKASVARLLAQGYGAIEIASWLGVSRQALGQKLRRWGLIADGPGTRKRIWDDDLLRFRPFFATEYRAQMANVRRRNKLEIRRREHARAVATIRSLAAALERTPTYVEIGAAMGWPTRFASQPQSRLAALVEPRQTYGQPAFNARRLFVEAGVHPPKLGRRPSPAALERGPGTDPPAERDEPANIEPGYYEG